MLNDITIGEEALLHAKKLVEELEAGHEEKAKQEMEHLARLRELDLFKEMGKLTRELHDSLKSFKIDSRIYDITEQDIPDAKSRLNYVIDMTEQAANKTLTAVEESIPLSEQIQQSSDTLNKQWSRFRTRELSVEEFREFSNELDQFFPKIADSAKKLNQNLSDVLMAQDFQDLTGQIIRRVISLVHDVEESLVDLMRISGEGRLQRKNGEVEESTEKGRDIKAEGPQMIGSKADVVQGQDEVDDLLSSLGF